MPDTPPAISVSTLAKHYEARRVFDAVSLSVSAGEALLLLGANGAGKSTLLAILAGRLKPDAGSASIAGFDVAKQAAQARARIGFVGHEPMLHPALTVAENLEWYAQMLGVCDAARCVAALVERFGLARVAATRLSLLSRGEQQRTALSRALLADPPVLLLDEPFTGLDEPARHEFSRTVTALRSEGRAILLTSHETELGLACATHVALLAGGGLAGPVTVGDAAALLKQYRAA